MPVQRKDPGRVRALVEQKERIYDAFEKSPRKSTRRASRQLEIPQTTVCLVLKR